MDDMNAGAKFPAQPDHQFNRLIFGGARTRLQIGFIAPRRALNANGFERTWQFGMDKQQAAVRANDGQGQPDICFVYMWKFVNARGHEEALESEHALCDQRFDLIGIARNHAAPKSRSYPALALCGFQLCA